MWAIKMRSFSFMMGWFLLKMHVYRCLVQACDFHRCGGYAIFQCIDVNLARMNFVGVMHSSWIVLNDQFNLFVLERFSVSALMAVAVTFFLIRRGQVNSKHVLYLPSAWDAYEFGIILTFGG